ncbi:YIP1 family protein [Haloferacaceae archaeon DSL9]
MTTWVENPRTGRDRGPSAIARAWLEVLVRPRRFFRVGVAPGDQAPGLSFAVLVALTYVTSLLAVSPEQVFAAGRIPVFGGNVPLTAMLVLLATAIFVAPAALHLAAAFQTVLLVPLVDDRAGVSETVQVVAYSTAPCALAGLPIPGVRAVCALYGSVLLIIGLATVHRTTFVRAALAGALPALLLFGYGFGGISGFEAVWRAIGA